MSDHLSELRILSRITVFQVLTTPDQTVLPQRAYDHSPYSSNDSFDAISSLAIPFHLTNYKGFSPCRKKQISPPCTH